MDEYNEFIDNITKGTHFLVVSHYSPDGDAIGSTLAVGMCLERMGKEVILYNRDELPRSLVFLPQSSKIVNKLEPNFSFDMSIMVDCAQQKRISDEFHLFGGKGTVACIDHHLLETPQAELILTDSEAASTGEVVLRLAKRLGIELDEALAQCIYTTLVVDTGFFRYSNTSAHTLELASELVNAGAVPWVVAKNIEESHPVSRMTLLGLSLASLKVSCKGFYATMDVTQEILTKSGATMEESDEFAVYPRSIDGVEVSALFREMEGGRIKVSMRSKDKVDVAAIARSFGGGGHARAAGFHMRAAMDDVKQKVLKAVLDAL